MTLSHRPVPGGIVVCGLIIVLLLTCASCKREAGDGKSNSVVITKTYWADSSLQGTFDLHLAEYQAFEPGEYPPLNAFEGFSNEGQDGLEEMSDKWLALFVDAPTVNCIHHSPNRDYLDLAAYHDDEMGIYTSKEWFPSLGSTALAITQYFGYYRLQSTGEVWLEMTHADIIFNYKNFKFSEYDHSSRASGTYDLLSIGLHELGHFWGLQHSPHHDAVMYPSIGQSVDKRDIDDYDRLAFQTIYGDLAVGAAPMRRALFAKNMAQNFQAADDPAPRAAADAPAAPTLDIGPWDGEDTLYRFVVEHRADGTVYEHPPVKFIPWCSATL
ncbi:MAG: matrixin family metalloprotease [Bacteriovoracaceae bacterium]|nr:matrixin family metalloprotease [Bacteriovoracaceae bacterium]